MVDTVVAKRADFEVPILALPLASYVTLGCTVRLSVP